MVFSALLGAMILALALEEKLHAKKSLITGTFAIITVLLADMLHILPIGAVVNVFDESLKMPVYITGIDWEVIAIIVGASLFVDVTSRSGLFTWIALKLTKASGGDPLKLLWYYGVLTVAFSAFLNNVTAMIIVGSLTAVSLNKLEQKPLLLGFLLIEGLLTNVGGLLTLISSVPNIIVGNTAGISFVAFFLASSPFVIVASALTIWLGARVFKVPALNSAEDKSRASKLIEGFDESSSIESPRFFRLSAVSFVMLIALFATASYLPYISELGLGFVAMAFGLFMLWSYKHEVDQFYKGLDWDLIFFFMTLFVVINVMEHAKVLELIGHGIKIVIALGPLAGGAGLLWGSALASAVTDNIPLAAVLAKVLALQQTAGDSPLWWSVIFGANLGGNITPIGSASTVVAVTVMHKHGIKLSFLGFVKLAVVFAVLQLAVATAYVLLLLS
jgi:Na+/H+ antiporter NhaD/arsenite permease-like protein